MGWSSWSIQIPENECSSAKVENPGAAEIRELLIATCDAD
jgi:hypothetical protein